MKLEPNTRSLYAATGVYAAVVSVFVFGPLTMKWIEFISGPSLDRSIAKFMSEHPFMVLVAIGICTAGVAFWLPIFHKFKSAILELGDGLILGTLANGREIHLELRAIASVLVGRDTAGRVKWVSLASDGEALKIAGFQHLDLLVRAMENDLGSRGAVFYVDSIKPKGLYLASTLIFLCVSAFSVLLLTLEHTQKVVLVSSAIFPIISTVIFLQQEVSGKYRWMALVLLISGWTVCLVVVMTYMMVNFLG